MGTVLLNCLWNMHFLFEMLADNVCLPSNISSSKCWIDSFSLVSNIVTGVANCNSVLICLVFSFSPIAYWFMQTLSKFVRSSFSPIKVGPCTHAFCTTKFYCLTRALHVNIISYSCRLTRWSTEYVLFYINWHKNIYDWLDVFEDQLSSWSWRIVKADFQS